MSQDLFGGVITSGAGEGVRLITGAPGVPLLSVLRAELAWARAVDVVVSFARVSGVVLCAPLFESALARGASVRVITSDYLGITQPEALWRLRDLAAGAGDEEGVGSLSLRVVETARMAGRSFHPKAWWVQQPQEAVAIVGSSNLSRAALLDGVEWNILLRARQAPEAVAQVRVAFEAIWGEAREVDDAWIHAYAARRVERAPEVFSGHAGTQDLVRQGGGAEAGVAQEQGDELLALPVPRDVQQEALDALAAAREAGARRALVVMATGLGKTWMVAMDLARLVAQRAPQQGALRVLVVAHRVELLRQAAQTFRAVFPRGAFGWCVAGRFALDAQVVLASVHTLARPQRLGALASQRFDYVWIDEAHHAAAPSYEAILRHLNADFVLGVTATPMRGDGRMIEPLLGEPIYEADLRAGIARRHLVPFHYLGVRDPVDYEHIPWRGGRFDAEALVDALNTSARMERLWQVWQSRPATRTLVFCATVQHAQYVARWLRERGVAAEAVFAGRESFDRQEAIARLQEGTLDALCVVDLFNEGVDIPRVDRVVFLRPTESPTLFLQQLGRGMRTAPGKSHVEVIDFVGNHHTFLTRLEELALMASETRVAALLRGVDDGDMPQGVALALPEGCLLDVELEAVDMLRQLQARADANPLTHTYRTMRAAMGRRPRAGELVAASARGNLPARAHEGWLAFVASQGDLSASEVDAFEAAGGWLRQLEAASPAQDPFMLALAEAIWQVYATEAAGAPVSIAHLAQALRQRSALIDTSAQDVATLLLAGDSGADAWRAGFLERIARELRGGFALGLQTQQITPAWTLPDEGHLALVALLREVLDWRWASRVADNASLSQVRRPVTCRVNMHEQHLTIVEGGAETWRGLVSATLPSGAVWVFEWDDTNTCHIARPTGRGHNALPSLLADLSGALDAARPQVIFTPAPDGWYLAPVAPSQTTVGPWPDVGTVWDAARLRRALVVSAAAPPRPWYEVGALVLYERGHLIAPDLVAALAPDDARTCDAVWVREGSDAYRMLGPAQREDDGTWRIAEVDLETWRALGPDGQRLGTSRVLPEVYTERAAQLTEALCRDGLPRWFSRADRTCRLIARRSSGGVQVDGGPDGFKPRNISLTDLGWVLRAQEHAQARGVALTEPLVNELRYLSGTPRTSTRYIDTGWALVLLDPDG